jgi:hypothetical protein
MKWAFVGPVALGIIGLMLVISFALYYPAAAAFLMFLFLVSMGVGFRIHDDFYLPRKLSEEEETRRYTESFLRRGFYR